MGKERLQRARPSTLDRLRSEIAAADRFITWVTWSCAAGMVLWSMLNATPYVRAHVAEGWEDTAFVLPLVVDAAFVGALRADEIASRHGVRAGAWPVLLRLFTGASSVFLNIGGSWEKGDWTGVFQHLVAPGLLVLLAEAGPAWRRSLAAKLTTAERTAEREERQQADRARREHQEDEDRKAENDRQEQERQRLQRLEDEERQRQQKREDEERALDLEERRESGRAKRDLDARRLDLEEKRLTRTIPPAHSRVDGTTANRNDGMTAHTAPVAPASARTVPAPAPVRTPLTVPAAVPAAPMPAPAAVRSPGHAPKGAPVPTPTAGPAPVRETASGAVAAAETRTQVSARIDVDHQEQPAEKAGPVKDWDIPGLPADCAPGRAPELLTDTQAHARIRYGHEHDWSQRRVATFAGRSPSTIHKHYSALAAK
ncbi:hypothetical protein ACFXJ6_40240 [Streptomyces sp. NPDC059218]|uniref:hypothetical protein n=1 Tax=unclassified Streptomyces TaxID=2593676 RepID=UPI0036AF3A66